MQEILKIKYRIFSQDEQGIWKYHENDRQYFNSYEEAIDYATALKLKGMIEEWITDDVDDSYGGSDTVDIMCDNFYKFNFENEKGISELNWTYIQEDRKILTPGYVFNYFRHYVDKATVLGDIVELISDKKNENWVV
jgi:hypothetical protein